MVYFLKKPIVKINNKMLAAAYVIVKIMASIKYKARLVRGKFS